MPVRRSLFSPVICPFNKDPLQLPLTFPGNVGHYMNTPLHSLLDMSSSSSSSSPSSFSAFPSSSSSKREFVELDVDQILSFNPSFNLSHSNEPQSQYYNKKNVPHPVLASNQQPHTSKKDLWNKPAFKKGSIFYEGNS